MPDHDDGAPVPLSQDSQRGQYRPNLVRPMGIRPWPNVGDDGIKEDDLRPKLVNHPLDCFQPLFFAEVDGLVPGVDSQHVGLHRVEAWPKGVAEPILCGEDESLSGFKLSHSRKAAAE